VTRGPVRVPITLASWLSCKMPAVLAALNYLDLASPSCGNAKGSTALAALPKVAFLQMPYLFPFRDTVDWEHWCSAFEEAGCERNIETFRA
jgi:hypothetical protein